MTNDQMIFTSNYSVVSLNIFENKMQSVNEQHFPHTKGSN